MFPGTDAAWVILGILEFLVFVVLVVSLLRAEFLPHRRKSAMMVALAIAMITFACLAFGQTATGQFEGTASLYQYFGATAVILILVTMLPPNRSDAWLTGGPGLAAVTFRRTYVVMTSPPRRSLTLIVWVPRVAVLPTFSDNLTVREAPAFGAATSLACVVPPARRSAFGATAVSVACRSARRPCRCAGRTPARRCGRGGPRRPRRGRRSA